LYVVWAPHGHALEKIAEQKVPSKVRSAEALKRVRSGGGYGHLSRYGWGYSPRKKKLNLSVEINVLLRILKE